ncbi:MAG: hypothetical protein LKF41_08290, partial [Bifidobacterium sp.]|nr:hypothetical protein [Bifidobacterium sp.]
MSDTENMAAHNDEDKNSSASLEDKNLEEGNLAEDSAGAKAQELDDKATPAPQETVTSVVQETLSVSYERLRHSINSQELSEVARKDLPDSTNQS